MVATQSNGQLSGLEKAAILLIGLGEELAAEVMKHLSQDEIERLSIEIARKDHVPPSLQEAVEEEFEQLAMARQYIAQGGVEYARTVLEKALGRQKAEEILDRVLSSMKVRPFDSLREADPNQLFQFLQKEHPQTIALVLVHLPPQKAAAILSALPPELQADVALRIITMDRTTPEVIEQVETLLSRKISTIGALETAPVGGPKSLVDMLNNADRSTEKTILDALAESNPEMADAVKQLMFVFEDIVKLDNRSMQVVLRHVEPDDLRLALKTASDAVKDAVFRNMSSRAAEALREDIEMTGPVRLRDVETAQQRVVAVIRQLEEAGEIIVGRGAEDVFVE
ncbi:MAG: flagellar motor switch protein FliG [Armatimonadota bacterium]